MPSRSKPVKSSISASVIGRPGPREAVRSGHEEDRFAVPESIDSQAVVD